MGVFLKWPGHLLLRRLAGCFDFPNLDNALGVTGGQPLPVRAEGDAMHLAVMAAAAGQYLAGRRVPDLHLRVEGGRRHQLPVRAEDRAGALAVVALEGPYFLA